MNGKLATWDSIEEIVSGIAVVVTPIFCINEKRLRVFPDLRADLATVITDEFAAYIVSALRTPVKGLVTARSA